MNIFRSNVFRALALGLALPLVALLWSAGCDVGSSDSTASSIADNEGKTYNYSGLYMSISNQSGSTNGYAGLVFPNGRQSGKALTWLRLLQYGSVLEGYDSAGLTWTGKISAQNGEIATFSLHGKTTAAQAVEILGTMAYASQLSTMDATWIEPTFSGSIFARATVSPVETNSPLKDVAINPSTAILTASSITQLFTASRGDGTYTWTYSGSGATLSPTTGQTVTLTRTGIGAGTLKVTSSGKTAEAEITCQ